MSHRALKSVESFFL